MGRIFISYRRQDSQHVAGRIYDRLVAQFGSDCIFKDVDSLPFGTKFPHYIREVIGKSDVFLTLIGERWLDIEDAKGSRRLDDAGDYVRLEIEEALRQGVKVLPVLLDGASMPSPENVPPVLNELVLINAVRVRPDPDFTHDVGRLTQAVMMLIAERQGELEDRRIKADRELNREQPDAGHLDFPEPLQISAEEDRRQQEAAITLTGANGERNSTAETAVPCENKRLRWNWLTALFGEVPTGPQESRSAYRLVEKVIVNLLGILLCVSILAIIVFTIALILVH